MTNWLWFKRESIILALMIWMLKESNDSLFLHMHVCGCGWTTDNHWFKANWWCLNIIQWALLNFLEGGIFYICHWKLSSEWLCMTADVIVSRAEGQMVLPYLSISVSPAGNIKLGRPHLKRDLFLKVPPKCMFNSAKKFTGLLRHGRWGKWWSRSYCILLLKINK